MNDWEFELVLEVREGWVSTVIGMRQRGRAYGVLV